MGYGPRVPAAERDPLHVVIACSGLDHARRGFETFARECFETLRPRTDVHAELIKGTGPRGYRERAVPTITRDSRAARALGRAARREPFIAEHVSFGLALMPLLARRRPDVVFFSEWHVGRLLVASRVADRLAFSLVFSNGALAPGGYAGLDRVQQLVPGAIEFTVARGEPRERQVLLPLGVAMPDAPTNPSSEARAELRGRLGLPPDRMVVLSAGAVNRQKRMDYAIEEIASLPQPRPYLLLAGQQEDQTPAIRRLAEERLGHGGYDIRTVPAAEMADVYRASDVFVLASQWESFGRVLVEAQSHGLPCLAHDYPVMRWVLGEEGDVADLTQRGALAGWVRALGPEAFSEQARRRRHEAAHRRFSWPMLADRYVEMLRAAARERRP